MVRWRNPGLAQAIARNMITVIYDRRARTMPRSFALGERFEAFIDAQVKEGRYNNASEVVRDALRLLEDEEKLRALRLAELHRIAEEGRASGLSDQDGEAVLDRLDAKYRALVDRRDI
jgi:antitoxin ParD1/3/4